MNTSKTGLFVVGSPHTAWGGLADLAGVRGDVKTIWEAFVVRGLADRSTSQTLVDETAGAIRPRFQAFLQELGLDAFAIFYFVGHGTVVGVNDLRLLLVDSSSSNPDQTTLSVLEVIQRLENSGVAEWAVVLDCCHAGEASRSRAIEGLRTKNNRGSLIVSATGSGPAWETPQHGGLLTHYLTSAVRSGACMPPGEEYVDLASAARHAGRQIAERHSAFGAVPRIELSGHANLRVARTPAPEQDRLPAPVESVLFIGATPPNADAATERWMLGACTTLGRLLAEKDIRLLICNPWNGSLDHHVALGYGGCTSARHIHLFMPEGKNTLANFEEFKQVLDNERVALERYWYPVVGAQEFSPETWLYCQLHALDHADAVLALGGALGRSASILLRLAEARGVPVVPFTFMRGEAEAAFERRKEFYSRLDIARHLTHRNGMEKLSEIFHAVTVARIDRSAAVQSVFISRAQEDSGQALLLVDQLTSRGIRPVFGDEPKVHEGDPLAVIHQRLRSVDTCALLWSAHFAISPHCYDELVLALKRYRQENLRIWLFRLDDTPIVYPEARSLDSWYTPTMRSFQAWARTILDSTVPTPK